MNRAEDNIEKRKRELKEKQEARERKREEVRRRKQELKEEEARRIATGEVVMDTSELMAREETPMVPEWWCSTRVFSLLFI